jgi:hypothetical protein
MSATTTLSAPRTGESRHDEYVYDLANAPVFVDRNTDGRNSITPRWLQVRFDGPRGYPWVAIRGPRLSPAHPGEDWWGHRFDYDAPHWVRPLVDAVVPRDWSPMGAEFRDWVPTWRPTDQDAMTRVGAALLRWRSWRVGWASARVKNAARLTTLGGGAAFLPRSVLVEYVEGGGAEVSLHGGRVLTRSGRPSKAVSVSRLWWGTPDRAPAWAAQFAVDQRPAWAAPVWTGTVLGSPRGAVRA